MSIRINISISTGLNYALCQYKHRFNVSKVCAEAIQIKVDNMILQDQRNEDLKESIFRFCDIEKIDLEDLREFFKTE